MKPQAVSYRWYQLTLQKEGERIKEELKSVEKGEKIEEEKKEASIVDRQEEEEETEEVVIMDLHEKRLHY